MNILSIDTSTPICSLAVSHGSRVIRYRNLKLGRALESSLMKWVDRLLKTSGMNLKNIDVLAVGLGPGGFTSLRVGLSAVKALSMASGIPVVGIPSLDIIAQQAINTPLNRVCVLMDAKRKLVYSAVYQLEDGQWNQVRDYALSSVEDVMDDLKQPVFFAGDAVSLYKDDIMKTLRSWKGFSRKEDGISEVITFPYAKDLAVLAAEQAQARNFIQADQLLPLYLYPEDCQVQATKR